jgi:hypothetical protein
MYNNARVNVCKQNSELIHREKPYEEEIIRLVWSDILFAACDSMHRWIAPEK